MIVKREKIEAQEKRREERRGGEKGLQRERERDVIIFRPGQANRAVEEV